MTIDELRYSVDAIGIDLKKELAAIRTLEKRAVDDMSVPMSRRHVVPLNANDDGMLSIYGLYYVHLYALIEFTIESVVQCAVDAINKSLVPVNSLPINVPSIAMDSYFSSFSDNRGKQWKRRMEFLNKERDDGPTKISAGAFGTELQNVWFDTVCTVYDVFGMSEEEFTRVPEAGDRLVIREIVEKRNKVAHGRERASVVGRGSNSSVLERKLVRVEAICNRIVSQVERCILERWLGNGLCEKGGWR